MRTFYRLWALFLSFAPIVVFAQEAQSLPMFQLRGNFDPVEFGFRFDDNVYRSVSANGRFSDELYLLDLGGNLNFRYDIFGGNLNYHLDADQYQTYSTLSNIKNDLDILISAEPGEIGIYYKKDYFIRNSDYYYFDYIDDDDLLGFSWTPKGPWNYEIKVKNFTRLYTDTAIDSLSKDFKVETLDFTDQAVFLSMERAIDDNFSMKLEGGYNNRQFYRYLVMQNGSSFETSDFFPLQNDETWTILLNAHIYFASVLQDINIEEERTNSNSYGFSNNVQSVSWAAVIRPVSSFYLQLFCRLYLKTYDVNPLNIPDLQIGYVDEDSQDLLSIKTSWEFSPKWMASLGASRVRTESTEPGQYYIKDIISAQVRRNF